MTFYRVSSNDRKGTLKTDVGQGAFIDYPYPMDGGIAFSQVKYLHKLKRFITQNGFAHHVAMVRGHYAGVVSEAVTRYLNWPMYHHSDQVDAKLLCRMIQSRTSKPNPKPYGCVAAPFAWCLTLSLVILAAIFPPSTPQPHDISVCCGLTPNSLIGPTVIVSSCPKAMSPGHFTLFQQPQAIYRKAGSTLTGRTDRN